MCLVFEKSYLILKENYFPLLILFQKMTQSKRAWQPKVRQQKYENSTKLQAREDYYPWREEIESEMAHSTEKGSKRRKTFERQNVQMSFLKVKQLILLRVRLLDVVQEQLSKFDLLHM